MTESAANPATADYRGNSATAAIRRIHCLVAFASTLVLLTVAILSLIMESPVAATPLENANENPNPPIAAAAIGIDPNTATWAELALLPGLGESVAKRIIETREQREPGERRPAFQRPEDLLVVKGIGVKTIQRMRHLLRFPTSAPPD
ncbi:MAG: helix-hairpin-helix domain-containing protein [Phycisphaerales bacterium]|nr:helix-hairpin-helix domain-containing protein [Phycisphaerales bacterium]MCB9863627.1 helix-hairpin-helix domain-containing protein [Phycisphaerales bacterium]